MLSPAPKENIFKYLFGGILNFKQPSFYNYFKNKEIVMLEEISRLKADLKKRLDFLISMNEASHAYLNEHFKSIRNEIDLDVETIISHLSESNKDEAKLEIEEKIASINTTREKCIQLIDESERKLLDKLETMDSKATSARCAELSDRIETLFPADPDDSHRTKMNDFEDRYEELALEILAETNKLEKCLLDSQSFIYIDSVLLDSREGEMGCLIHLVEDYLSREEIICLK